MPDLFRSRTVFDDAKNYNVLYTMGDLASPVMRTVDTTKILPATGGNRIIYPGTVLLNGNGAASGYSRAFPGSYATATTATSSPTIVVKNATVFNVGDVIVKGAPGSTAALGTILTINVDTNTITLAANSTTAVVIGDSIWVNVSTLAADVIGLVVRLHDFGISSNDVAAYKSASVYRDRLQFWNTAIQAVLPEIKLCP